jgi:hypothetical protein
MPIIKTPEIETDLEGIPQNSILPPWSPQLSDVYMIIYKEGSNLITRYFAFKYEGDPTNPQYFKNAKFAAIQRAQTYCTKMRYRFVHCQPFLEDLDWREEHISAM